ncbi:membrane protein insertase YidC [Brevibacillus fluminis]|uniref:Membrane protein insertase YidC n=1 Tax=Brevibacillus fluminis TaxID=511487 RepID=A0A3M8DJW1_9BACL|nr:YidC/Oxa1 family membrane protein insertase [Brevibacillus fluminis]RNB87741.1 membrane protein insertase YidC [Brevibacillus fluminis]
MQAFVQPIVTLLASLLTAIFSFAQDWGIAIILLTLLVRSLLFPLNLRNARQQVLQSLVQPKLKQLREEHKEDQAKLMQETMTLYKTAGIKPLSTIATSFLQMPIFVAMYGLFLSHGAAMSSSLIPWVVTFAQNDAWHILPTLAAGLTFITSMIPLTSEMITQAPLGQRIGMSMIMVVVFIMILWKAPVALGLYWMTGSLFGLLERGFYRTSIGKKLLLRGKPQLLARSE